MCQKCSKMSLGKITCGDEVKFLKRKSDAYIHKAYSCQPRGSCLFQVSHWELIFLTFFHFFPEFFPLKFRGSMCIDCKVIDPNPITLPMCFLNRLLEAFKKSFQFYLCNHSFYPLHFFLILSLSLLYMSISISRLKVRIDRQIYKFDEHVNSFIKADDINSRP